MESKSDIKIPTARIAILGDSCAGKTSFMNRLIKRDFPHQTISSCGLEYFFVETDANKFCFIDTPGTKLFNVTQHLRSIDRYVILYEHGKYTKENINGQINHWKESMMLSNESSVCIGAIGISHSVTNDQKPKHTKYIIKTQDSVETAIHILSTMHTSLKS